MSWGNYEDECGHYHVIPINDLKDHEISASCKCDCSFEDGVYIHNSYDERELTENLKPS